MELIIGANVIRTIGLDLTLKCVSVLTTSAQGIYSLITNIKSTHPLYVEDVSKILKELYLEKYILILESLLKEINIEKHHTKTLALCLESLKTCVLEIENVLGTINNRVIYNKSLWLGKSIRSFGFEDIISSLQLLKKNMDNRTNKLFEVIKINHKLNPYLDVDSECDISIIEPL